jgi:hypothetical protein
LEWPSQNKKHPMVPQCFERSEETWQLMAVSCARLAFPR